MRALRAGRGGDSRRRLTAPTPAFRRSSTAAQYEALRRAGVTTIVDQRQLSTKAAAAESARLARFGLHSVLIPMPDGGIFSPTQVQ